MFWLWWVVLYLLIGAGVSKAFTPRILHEIESDPKLKDAIAPMGMKRWEFYGTHALFWPLALWIVLLIRKDGKKR